MLDDVIEIIALPYKRLACQVRNEFKTAVLVDMLLQKLQKLLKQAYKSYKNIRVSDLY